MKCEKYLNLIDDLVEGELNEQIARQVNSHVFACAECCALYENVKREKDIYAHFLFDAEPSNDLWANFQAKLQTETVKASRSEKILAGINDWKENFFGFLRLSSALACAALIVMLGISFVLFNFLINENASKNDYLIVSQPKTSAVIKAEAMDLSTGEKANKNNVSSKNTIAKKRFSSANPKHETIIKIASVKETKIKKKAIPETRRVDPDEIAQSTEERLLIKQIKALESEAAKQAEKIELLLRSFRNARSEEGSEAFDVAYEKEQARRLLEKNVRLRRTAETYGSLYTEEILSRVEPYLLDIANLESNTSAEKVRDIKERVKNQNIIASLQIY